MANRVQGMVASNEDRVPSSAWYVTGESMAGSFQGGWARPIAGKVRKWKPGLPRRRERVPGICLVRPHASLR